MYLNWFRFCTRFPLDFVARLNSHHQFNFATVVCAITFHSIDRIKKKREFPLLRVLQIWYELCVYVCKSLDAVIIVGH